MWSCVREDMCFWRTLVGITNENICLGFQFLAHMVWRNRDITSSSYFQFRDDPAQKCVYASEWQLFYGKAFGFSENTI